MIVSLNWIKQYLDVDLSPDKISEILTEIGLEVEGMEETVSVPGGLEGFVVGYVKECGKHTNSDHLSVTKVDIGSGEDLNIVCGAPNVAQGQKVVVATIGTILYPPDGKEFKIKKGKIRGEVSEGMICALDEMNLGSDHSGIAVLPDDVAVGTLAKDYFDIEKDVIYDIGLTPNRSDATSHLGVAKDLAAALKVNYGHSGKVNVPSVDDFKVDSTDLPIDVEVENTDACPRYSGLTIKGIKVGDSPEWMQKRLNAIGVRPINNVVDITNFVLHELGQPLHAFDYEKIAGKKIIVKNLADQTPFLCLDEIERKLSDKDLMICDGNGVGMCIAGVFGGLNSGVTPETTEIFLESAYFTAKSIRPTSTRHLLRTDAAKIFEKGSDPNITVFALKRAAELIAEYAGGKVASEIIDIYPKEIKPVEIEISYAKINRDIGVPIPPTKVNAIFEAMEMEIKKIERASVTVAVPTNKADVTRPADLIEEVLRIYGLNQVPIPTEIRSTIVHPPKPNPIQMRKTAADLLVAQGFYEMMAVSLTKSDYYKDVLPKDENQLVFINNTSNRDLNIMRPEMLISGLEVVLRNQNRQIADLKVFEQGRSYLKTDDGFDETEHLTLFLTGQQMGESWLNPNKNKISFFTLKGYVGGLMERFGLKGFQEKEFADDVFSYGVEYHRGRQSLVKFGKVQTSILKKMGISNEVFFADFNWNNIMTALKNNKINFVGLNKYPSMRRDLAFVINKNVQFKDILAISKKAGKALLVETNLFDVYENEKQLGEGKKSYAVSFVFENPEKTLKDKEVDKIMKNIIFQSEKQLGAVIRK